MSRERQLAIICVKQSTMVKASEEIAGLNTYALNSVFDIEKATLILEFETEEHPAAIYQKGDYHFACCTVSPELSVVLSYHPMDLQDEAAVLVIRSIFEGAEVAEGYIP